MERYLRQIPVLGEEGQERLRDSTVLIAGLGGLGSPAAYYLAAAGVGRLVLVDDGAVELSNLNRQILHRERDVGRSKVESAAEKLSELNPTISIVSMTTRITPDNSLDLLKEAGADVVVDCLDNFTARYALADAAWRLGVPFVHGAVEGLYGQVTTILPGRTLSLRELFPKVGDREDIPILGPTAGVVGSIEALEAIKLITGAGKPLLNRLLIVDLTDYSFEVVSLER
ncbi:MAG: HesA/MoeB/ThiF family protein [Thermococci archaeon]|nr:HesA/MoeB/ThiF family protein [Thermococci archaeon]